MIGAIANGTSRLTNYSTSADSASTISCLENLGVRIDRTGAEVLVHGVGQNGLRAPIEELDCGNSGTTMRLLAGILAGQNFTSILTGDQSLRSRPMQRIIEPLEMMGAKVDSNNGRPPLTIHGRRPLKAIDYELLVASAQVKSCILLAALNAQDKTTVVENQATRDHTERLLSLFGAHIETGNEPHKPDTARFAALTGAIQLQAHDVLVPGDISSAAYFIAAAGLLPGSELELGGVGLNPTRNFFMNQMESLGLNAVSSQAHEKYNEPIGVVWVRGTKLERTATSLQLTLTVRGALIPQLIDELPLLAVAGSQFAQGIEIRDAKELRVKESDRIAATVAGLRAMGCEVEEFDDGMRVNGPTKLKGAKIDSRGDHRIAMSFTIAGLLADGETEIVDADCVAVSFPEFFDLLDSVIERWNEPTDRHSRFHGLRQNNGRAGTRAVAGMRVHRS